MDDVQQFIQKLNEKEGTNKYRLPSEAEWNMQRAPERTRYFFWYDNSSLGDYAWYIDNSDDKLIQSAKESQCMGTLWHVWQCMEMDTGYMALMTIMVLRPMEVPGKEWSSHVIRGGSYASDTRDCESAGRSPSLTMVWAAASAFALSGICSDFSLYRFSTYHNIYVI